MRNPSRTQRRLIVNADGYGLSSGVNRAIEDVCASGFVRSISVNANGPAVEELAGFVRRFPDVGVGVHFNLVVGRPVLDPARVPTLVDETGEFWGEAFRKRAWSGRLKKAEMEAELFAQVERLEGLGAALDHWDSHEGTHVVPPFLQAAMRVAGRRRLRFMRCHDYWLPTGQVWPVLRYFGRNPVRLGTFAARRAAMALFRARGFRMADRSVLLGALPGTAPHAAATWRLLLEVLPPGTTEVWCHPGYPDEELRRLVTLVETREGEARVLQDPALVRIARERGVALIRFRDLAGGGGA